MSCNGCRVLRKGCSESCILRPCLQWIESPEAQGNATVFVAKFFGRAGLMSFISAVPEIQRPALFQSLLFEACGRTVNPVNGAVGLLWTGNWHVCQAAMETILRGGKLSPITKVLDGNLTPLSDDMSEDPYYFQSKKRQIFEDVAKLQPFDLDLCLSPGFSKKFSSGGEMMNHQLRPATPSMNSEESVTTSLDSGAASDRARVELKLLNLFV